MAGATATQEAFWLRFLLEEMGLNVGTPIVLREDDKACISFPDHPGNHRYSKHIDYRHHFVRESFQRGDIAITTYAIFLCCSIEIIYVTSYNIYTKISNSVFNSSQLFSYYLIIFSQYPSPQV